MKTVYRKIDEDNIYVYAQSDEFPDHDHETPIGLVTREINKTVRWSITAYFICLIEDTININDTYYDSVKAGRVLVDSWRNIQLHTKNKKLGPDDTWPDDWPDLFKNIP
jgi:hypothetical protein